MAYRNGVVTLSAIGASLGVSRQYASEMCKDAAGVFISALKKINPDIYDSFNDSGISDEEIICIMLYFYNKIGGCGSIGIEERVLLILDVRGEQSARGLHKRWFSPNGVNVRDIYDVLDRLESSGEIKSASYNGPLMYRINKKK